MSELELAAKALDFCVDAHRGQFRDGEAAVPYACHPVEVMLTLRHFAGVKDEVVLTAALLHDTVEDTAATSEEIRREFGDAVADLVAEVTRVEPERPEGMSKEDHWMLRSGLLLDEIAVMSHGARLIKLSDRLSNITESEKTRTGSKLERYRRQTVWILQSIPRETHAGLWDAIAAVIGMSEKNIQSSARFSDKK
jgi:GTP diphosphokinase / guanosine-3',5'-bis(diphosphate) 3'-diphosphatase